MEPDSTEMVVIRNEAFVPSLRKYIFSIIHSPKWPSVNHNYP